MLGPLLFFAAVTVRAASKTVVNTVLMIVLVYFVTVEFTVCQAVEVCSAVAKVVEVG